MFFALSTQPVMDFPMQTWLTPTLCLSHDHGWHMLEQDSGDRVMIKGYANDRTITEAAQHCAANPGAPQLRGNFCAMVIRDGRVTITHDTDRSFPLWVGKNTVTNLEPMGDKVLADIVLTVDGKFAISQQWHTPWRHTAVPNMSDEDIVDNVHEILLETFDSFLSHNRLPLKAFLTGGMDTTMAWAYLDHFTKDYEMVDYEYLKLTPFWKRNSSKLKRFWGYTQTHLWSEDCVLVSGALGDGSFLRGLGPAEMMLQAHGTSLSDVLQTKDYHYKYYQTNFNKREVGTMNLDINKVRGKVMDRSTNNHQHWHIEQTLHFTPFKDSRIPALITRSSKEQVVLQARNGHINRLLIEKLDPDKLTKISAFKNHDRMGNL